MSRGLQLKSVNMPPPPSHIVWDVEEQNTAIFSLEPKRRRKKIFEEPNYQQYGADKTNRSIIQQLTRIPSNSQQFDPKLNNQVIYSNRPNQPVNNNTANQKISQIQQLSPLFFQGFLDGSKNDFARLDSVDKSRNALLRGNALPRNNGLLTIQQQSMVGPNSVLENMQTGTFSPIVFEQTQQSYANEDKQIKSPNDKMVLLNLLNKTMQTNQGTLQSVQRFPQQARQPKVSQKVNIYAQAPPPREDSIHNYKVSNTVIPVPNWHPQVDAVKARINELNAAGLQMSKKTDQVIAVSDRTLTGQLEAERRQAAIESDICRLNLTTTSLQKEVKERHLAVNLKQIDLQQASQLTKAALQSEIENHQTRLLAHGKAQNQLKRQQEYLNDMSVQSRHDIKQLKQQLSKVTVRVSQIDKRIPTIELDDRTLQKIPRMVELSGPFERVRSNNPYMAVGKPVNNYRAAVSPLRMTPSMSYPTPDHIGIQVTPVYKQKEGYICSKHSHKHERHLLDLSSQTRKAAGVAERKSPFEVELE